MDGSASYVADVLLDHHLECRDRSRSQPRHLPAPCRSALLPTAHDHSCECHPRCEQPAIDLTDLKGRIPGTDRWKPIDENPEAEEDASGVLIVRIRENLDFGECLFYAPDVLF